MSQQIPFGLAHHIRGLAALWQDDQRNDDQLMAAFADAGDQSAFTTLVCRHGASVWAVCRSLLTDCADAEDAFQATFIALARKCREACPESVSGWLTGVAHNVALNIHKASCRREAAHRRLCEQARPACSKTPLDDEFRAVMHEELDGLPRGLRAPLVLYYLEGRTQPEIGRILGMPNQTVSYRIRKGLNTLRKRLAKRGLVVTTTALVALLGGVPVVFAVPPGLMASTAVAAFRATAESAIPAATSPVLTGLVLSPLFKTLMIGFVVVVALVAGYWAYPPAGKTEVKGSVRLDSEPLARAEIVLVPDSGANQPKNAVRTLTDQDGQFRDQVAPGRYRVLVLDHVADKPKRETWSVPPNYRVAIQTPLRVDVGDSPVVLDIPITPVIRHKQTIYPSPSPEQQLRLKLLALAWIAPQEEFGRFER